MWLVVGGSEQGKSHESVRSGDLPRPVAAASSLLPPPPLTQQTVPALASRVISHSQPSHFTITSVSPLSNKYLQHCLLCHDMIC